MSELLGLWTAVAWSFARKVGSSVSPGWLVPMGLDAKYVNRSRSSRPVVASRSQEPWEPARSTTRSYPSTSRWRASDGRTSSALIDELVRVCVITAMAGRYRWMSGQINA
ncbi:MAG: hypothetical protein PGN11_19265 [Quadrisphaera sp.]